MSTAPIVALAGGVGAARFLRGLVRAAPPESLTVIVNTGDDREFYGVKVSPDLDIVAYTLAERVDEKKGWGLAGDTTQVIDALGALGHETWFRLGDRDFAQCLHRTLELRRGQTLAQVTDGIRRNLGLATRLLPMSEQSCPSLIKLEDDRCIHFEEYLVRERAPDNVRGVDLSAAQAALPAAGVVEAIEAAHTILVCPSNPVVSIGPIVSIPGIRDALAATAAPIVAVTPIVAGAPLKGPADRLLRAVGAEVSALGVATLYRDWIDGFVLDERDAEQSSEIEALGLRTAVVDTVMRDVEKAQALAAASLELARKLS